MIGKNRITIIIGDDNLELCKLMQTYLQEFSDIEILGTTSDGEEQIKMIELLKPNIVITDLKRNTGISGWEVLKKCHELQLDETKFIVATAAYYRETMEKLKNMGIKHILFKPFPFKNLINEIREIENEEENSLTIINNDISKSKRTFIAVLRQKLMSLKIIR